MILWSTECTYEQLGKINMTITVKQFREYLKTLPDDTVIECLEIIDGYDGYAYTWNKLEIIDSCEFLPKIESLPGDKNILRIGKI